MGHTAAAPSLLRRTLDGIAILSGWLAAVGAMTSPAGYPVLAATAFQAGLVGLAGVALARLAFRNSVRLPNLPRNPSPEPDSAALRLVVVLVAIAAAALTIGMTIRAQLLLPLFDGGMESTAVVVQYPWLAMALSDLYGGFILAAAWLAYRERDGLWAGILIYLLWFWGNMLIGLYVVWLVARGATVRQLLLGKHS